MLRQSPRANFQFLSSILYYDHLITFGEEHRYIWKSVPSGAALLFLLNRYWAFLVVKCHRAGRELRKISFTCAASITAFGDRSLSWSHNSSSPLYNTCVSTALLSVSIWSVTGQTSEITLQEGCQFASSRITAVHIATAWEALFTFDLLIFSLTIARTYNTRIRYGYGNGRTMDLVTLMVRDGAVYFGAMVLVQGANVITFYASGPLLRGTLSTLASDVSVTMMSRLMLNLHRTAADNDIFATTLDPTSLHTRNGEMQFTTRPFHDASLSVSVSDSEGAGGEHYGHVRLPQTQLSSELSTEGDFEMSDFSIGKSVGSV
ncbi:hypothetical protein BC629DRAFT_900736 [Irpex lacteus]|nr:hypothetical protein BC629DRAFT_900736 [Irpex lacteus]